MLPKFSVRKPYTVLVGVVVILVLGYLSFTNMSMDFLPNMEFPYAIVMTTYPGASPEEVELSVTTPVEAAMARIGGVKEIQSVSNQNLSIVIMEFNDGTDMNGATIDMRESLDQIEGYWDDTISSPTIMKINPDSLPVMVAAIDYDDIDSVEASRRAESDIIPELESVEGVASVTSTGQVTERVDVTLSDSKIEAMNKKVSDALDGKFSDAEEKIDKGQKKIEKGKKTLDEKKDEAAEKMAEGQGELNKATGQIDEGLKEINTQIAAIKEQKKTLKTNEKELQTAKATLLAQKKNVEATITTLENMKSALETAKKGLEELDKKISALKSQISAGGSDTAELEGQLAALIALRKSTVEELAKYGVSEDEIDDLIDKMRKFSKEDLRIRDYKAIAEAAGYDLDKIKKAFKLADMQENI